MIAVNIVGALLIAFIVWWFWLYREPKTSVAKNNAIISVADGTYQPSHIQVQAGTPATLTFLRKDASPCAEMVIFPDLEISESLVVGKTQKVELPSLKPGEYPFHCQMQMYRGVLVAE